MRGTRRLLLLSYDNSIHPEAREEAGCAGENEEADITDRSLPSSVLHTKGGFTMTSIPDFYWNTFGWNRIHLVGARQHDRARISICWTSAPSLSMEQLRAIVMEMIG